MFSVENLHATIDGKVILKGINLQVRSGEVHALMGPNGAGKSTFSKVVAGHPFYTVEEGKILFEGEDILELEPDERAKRGIFVSSQYPIEIPGVTNRDFLFEMFKAHHAEANESEFHGKVEQILHELSMSSDFLDRDLNAGFSGGEKKRNEILQMKLMKPKLAILDETDSGLDIDALKHIAKNIQSFVSVDTAVILITHYQRLLDYITPNFVHIMSEGKIIQSGNKELAMYIESEGYQQC